MKTIRTFLFVFLFITAHADARSALIDSLFRHGESEFSGYNTGEIFHQDDSFSHYAIYAELFGSGIFYSLNCEYRIAQSFGIRAGGGIINSRNDKRHFTNLLLMGMFIPKISGGGLEYGAGVIVVRERDADGSVRLGPAGALSIGYRYQPFDHGILFRATWTPFIYKRQVDYNHGDVSYFRSMAGVTLGYAF